MKKLFTVLALALSLTSCAEVTDGLRDISQGVFFQKRIGSISKEQASNDSESYEENWTNAEDKLEEEWLEQQGGLRAIPEKTFKVNNQTVKLKKGWGRGNNCYVILYFRTNNTITKPFAEICYDITTIKTKQEGNKIIIITQEKGKSKMQYTYLNGKVTSKTIK